MYEGCKRVVVVMSETACNIMARLTEWEGIGIWLRVEGFVGTFHGPGHRVLDTGVMIDPRTHREGKYITVPPGILRFFYSFFRSEISTGILKTDFSRMDS